MRFFSAKNIAGIALTCQIEGAEFPFYVVIAAQTLQIVPGLAENAALHLKVTDLRQFVGVLNGVVALDAALARGSLSIAQPSEQPRLQQFVALFDPVPQAVS